MKSRTVSRSKLDEVCERAARFHRMQVADRETPLELQYSVTGRTRREAERGQTPATTSLPADDYEALSDEELRQAIAARVAHLRGS